MKKTILNTFFTTALISAALILPGCGGGGSSSSSTTTYTGNTLAAVIDSTNASEIGTNAGAAVKVASDAQNGGNLPVAVTVNGSSNQSNMGAVSQNLVNFFRNQGHQNLPTGVTSSQPGSCGGSVTFTGNQPPASGPYSATATFTNYCDSTYTGSTLVFSGTVVFSTNDISGYASTLTFSNFVITENGQTTTINSMTLSCDASYNCTYSSDYIGPDGTTVYRTADFSITDNGSGALSGTLTFYDPTNGYVSATATGLTYGSCGDFPDGGTIVISDTGGNTASITFSSSCTYSGTYTPSGGTAVAISGTAS